MKIVIAALVRGYKETKNYKNLIKRNKFIYKNIICKTDQKIELILFHEGNISIEHQDFINSKSLEKYKFIDVSEKFIINNYLNNNNISDFNRFGNGYRLMCKFNFYHIWEYLKDYDYLIRIDEDVVIKKFNWSIFKNLNKDFVFGTVNLTSETHVPTNASLPQELKRIFNSDDTSFYNHKFPYTNFYISKISFWNSNEISDLLKRIAENEMQYIYRWGDLPVIGSVLNYKKIKIELFKNITYKHLSHKNFFKISKKIK